MNLTSQFSLKWSKDFLTQQAMGPTSGRTTKILQISTDYVTPIMNIKNGANTSFGFKSTFDADTVRIIKPNVKQWMVKMTWHYKMNENRRKRKLETSSSQAEPISNVGSSKGEVCNNGNSVRIASELLVTNQVLLAPTPL